MPHRLFKDFSSGGALLVILEQTLAYMKDKRMRSLEELQTQVAVFVLLYAYSKYVFVLIYWYSVDEGQAHAEPRRAPDVGGSVCTLVLVQQVN